MLLVHLVHPILLFLGVEFQVPHEFTLSTHYLLMNSGHWLASLRKDDFAREADIIILLYCQGDIGNVAEIIEEKARVFLSPIASNTDVLFST
jgi:hypothetical protein